MVKRHVETQQQEEKILIKFIYRNWTVTTHITKPKLVWFT